MGVQQCLHNPQTPQTSQGGRKEIRSRSQFLYDRHLSKKREGEEEARKESGHFFVFVLSCVFYNFRDPILSFKMKIKMKYDFSGVEKPNPIIPVNQLQQISWWWRPLNRRREENKSVRGRRGRRKIDPRGPKEKDKERGRENRKSWEKDGTKGKGSENCREKIIRRWHLR